VNDKRPVEGPAPSLAWPVVHSAAEPPLKRGNRLMPSPHRFPPPWTTEETDACFIVRDANGQALAYVCFRGRAGNGAPADAGRGHPGSRGE
jgi:hypothetical protein